MRAPTMGTFGDGASEGGYIIRPYSVSKKSVIKREGGCLGMRQPPQTVEKVQLFLGFFAYFWYNRMRGE